MIDKPNYLLNRRYFVTFQERMAFLETEGARNVIEACGRAAYVKRCIFTSSLLATLWIGNDNLEPVRIDESCWSNEEFCRENKAWLLILAHYLISENNHHLLLNLN